MSLLNLKERAYEKKLRKLEDAQCSYNSIKSSTNVLFNTILTILSLLSVIPFIFVIIISLTDEESLAMNGYRFIPEKWSFYAYEYIVSAGENIIRSYGVTILVTVTGTLLGLLLTGTYAYALSRKTYEFHVFFRRYDRQLPDRDQGADAEKYHLGADLAVVPELLQHHRAADIFQNKHSRFGGGVGKDRRGIGVAPVL